MALTLAGGGALAYDVDHEVIAKWANLVINMFGRGRLRAEDGRGSGGLEY